MLTVYTVHVDTLHTVNRHSLLINMYCAYSQQALYINQHVYTVNRHSLLVNMYCAYSQQELPITVHVD
jgi:hypothetical protein